jgi:dethiobiotin synthetase
MSPLKIFVTGIGTGVGKTFVSAALVETLAADYWKPIQTGSIEITDSHTIRSLTYNYASIHAESYCLREPLSPHAAAELEDVTINWRAIECPKTDNHLIIEGAGGLLVPLTYTDTLADLIVHLAIPVCLVVRIYLGCINHTLLTIEALRQRKIQIFGIVFVGTENIQTQKVIVQQSGVNRFVRLPEYAVVDRLAVADAACILKEWLLDV